LTLQHVITASQSHVTMEEIALIPEVVTYASARLVTLGRTATVNIIAITCSFDI